MVFIKAMSRPLAITYFQIFTRSIFSFIKKIARFDAEKLCLETKEKEIVYLLLILIVAYF